MQKDNVHYDYVYSTEKCISHNVYNVCIKYC